MQILLFAVQYIYRRFWTERVNKNIIWYMSLRQRIWQGTSCLLDGSSMCNRICVNKDGTPGMGSICLFYCLHHALLFWFASSNLIMTSWTCNSHHWTNQNCIFCPIFVLAICDFNNWNIYTMVYATIPKTNRARYITDTSGTRSTLFSYSLHPALLFLFTSRHLIIGVQFSQKIWFKFYCFGAITYQL